MTSRSTALSATKPSDLFFRLRSLLGGQRAQGAARRGDVLVVQRPRNERALSQAWKKVSAP